VNGAAPGAAKEAAFEPILTTAASFALSCIPGSASSLNGSIPSNQAKLFFHNSTKYRTFLPFFPKY
jgi:hypothetical protein